MLASTHELRWVKKKKHEKTILKARRKQSNPYPAPLQATPFFPYHAFSIALLLAHQSAEDMKPTGYKLLFKTRYK